MNRVIKIMALAAAFWAGARWKHWQLRREWDSLEWFEQEKWGGP